MTPGGEVRHDGGPRRRRTFGKGKPVNKEDHTRDITIWIKDIGKDLLIGFSGRLPFPRRAKSYAWRAGRIIAHQRQIKEHRGYPWIGEMHFHSNVVSARLQPTRFHPQP